MTRYIRTLLGVAAVAAATSVAGAQAPQQDSATAHHAHSSAAKGKKAKTHARAAHKSDSTAAKPARKHRASSGGEVDLVRTGVHATSRDFVGADDPRCDDLCQHEKMMDAKFGKDRERRPGGA